MWILLLTCFVAALLVALCAVIAGAVLACRFFWRTGKKIGSEAKQIGSTAVTHSKKGDSADLIGANIFELIFTTISNLWS